MAIDYPYKFTDIYNNNATLYGFQLDANFNVITSGLNSIVNSITNSNSNEFRLDDTRSFFADDPALVIKTVNYNTNPLQNVYNGLKISGYISIYTGYQSPQGLKLYVDDIPPYPLFIKNKLVAGQSLGIPNPKNAIGTGYNSFTFDEALQGWLYEGDIPTGCLKFHALTSRNETDYIAQMENITGYIMLGGDNLKWSNIDPAEIEPFGFLLDSLGNPFDYNGYVGAGLSSTYTPELGKRYLGLNTKDLASQGVVYSGKVYDNTGLVTSASGDLTLSQGNVEHSGFFVTTNTGYSNTLTYKVKELDNNTITKRWNGAIWLKL